MARPSTTTPNEAKTRIIDLGLSPVEAAAALRHEPGMVFLDSASADDPANANVGSATAPNAPRHSLLAAAPVEIIRGRIDDPAALRQALARHRPATDQGADLGFPSGGAIGWIDYKGDFCFGIYPQAMVYDHLAERWSEIGRLSERLRPANSTLPASSHRAAGFREMTDRDKFCRMVERAQEYIAAGDIYQVNLAQRYRADWPDDDEAGFAFYCRLRDASPAPFASYMNLDDRQVMSSSPELFLELSGSLARTRPIKGTRPRFRDATQDEKSAYDLITSPKEISELIMITDLERNDLGRICEFGSVRASELLKLERHEHVFHLVSTVEGQLRSEVDHLDAIRACFPGGSITGAPKKRAREIIDELETEPRGLYTGAIGVIGFDGETRLSIAIRTAIAEAGELHFHVGAGIVADSDPALEYEETLHKARGLFAGNAAEPG